MMKSTTNLIELRPHHCGISVPDLESSIAWYRDMLGFSLVSRSTLDAAHAKVAHIKYGDFLIELFEVAGAAPLPESRRYPNQDLATHGTKHIAFAVRNVSNFMDTLKKRGVDIAMEKPAFIRDNAGTLIEIMELSD
jgi:methylmalonyl-CoA/ethylmalonyl-CoA epimerase